jgi:chemotaxis protein CheY-P-specific phosphatase CheC
MGMVVNSFQSKKSNLMEKIHLSFSPALSIYNQAVLERSKPIQLFSKLEIETEGRVNILFKLEGELAGHIICSFLIENKEITKDQLFQYQSIFTESMNILLGKFLTQLEDVSGLMSLISSPKLLSNNKFINEINDFPHTTKLKTQYQLLTMKNSFDCTIYINANNKSSSKV